MELNPQSFAGPDPKPWLDQAQALMMAPGHGSPASRQRRALVALDQARASGASEAAMDAAALGASLQCLSEALEAAGFARASTSSRALAATTALAIPAAGCGDHNLPGVDLSILDGWIYPRCMRRYQQWVLQGVEFELQLEDGPYALVACRADLDRNRLVLRHRGDGSLRLLLSGECSEGYPLSGQPLLIPDGEEPTSATFGPAIVRAGNANFAHFIWNELDPLLQLVASGMLLDVLQDSDTVLNLGQLPGVRCVVASELAHRSSIRLGSTLVTAAARRVVLAALRAEPLDDLPRARGIPLILLGVRGPGRRELVNEVDYYTALIGALRETFASPFILLDGFTYQHDNRDVWPMQQREKSCTARVDAIIDHCGNGGLENLSGLDFASWLQRSEGIQFYVTHEGTMQHKVGWLRPEIPGLCLVGSADAEAIAAWHRSQCEGAGLVATLPPALFSQESIQAGQDVLVDERNRPFRILDVSLAVDLTMALITATLDRH